MKSLSSVVQVVKINALKTINLISSYKISVRNKKVYILRTEERLLLENN